MFFEFDQNNSGGSFSVDKKLCQRLFIESKNIQEAISKAKDMGVYFDGVEKGIDCSCCGDRWYQPKIIKFPYVYSNEKTFKDIEAYAQYLADKYGWTDPDARIFYANGEVKEIYTNKKNKEPK